MNLLKKKKSQGNYLKETTFDFLVPTVINIPYTKRFLTELVNIIDTKLLHIQVNELPPGWDILVSIKDSCIYFGYWGEYKYVHLIIASCKEYNVEKVSAFIQKAFKVIPRIQIIRDIKIEDLIKGLK